MWRKPKASYRELIKDVLLYILLLVVLTIAISSKEDFHVDELLTYNLANDDSWFEPEDGISYRPANQAFLDAMTSNGTFELDHVWEQQKNDVHPPLYYILVHAICTLFPNSFSVWYAAVINVLFAILTLHIFRKIVCLFINNIHVNYMISLAYIFSAGVISLSTFMRMYVMVMFWVTLFAYIILKNISKFRWEVFLELALITIGGALTHYYFILYVFFMSAVIVIVLVFQKRIKEILMYLLSMIISGMISYFIFPPMLTHILGSGHSKIAVEKFTSANFLEQLKIFYDILNNNLFGGFGGIVVLAIMFFLCIVFVNTIKNKQMESLYNSLEVQRYILVIVPVLLYILFVSKTASHNVDRYVSPIYAVLLAGIMCIMCRCVMKVITKEKYSYIFLAVVLCIMVSSSYSTCYWEYLYISNKERISNAEEFGADADAICIYDKAWKINQYFLVISKCKSVTFYEYDELVEDREYDYLGGNIMFFLIGIDSDKFMEDFLEDNPEYKVVNNEQYGYGTSIYVRN